MSKNASSADNQQGSLRDPSETTRQAPLSKKAIKTYLLGSLHDGTFSSNERFRISQKGTEWLKTLQKLFTKVGYNSWIYKEGKDRKVYVLETLADFLDFKFDPLRLNKNVEKISYTGKIHNPSQKVDPGHWRMYVLADSQRTFVTKIRSWHPRKIRTLRKRTMI